MKKISIGVRKMYDSVLDKLCEELNKGYLSDLKWLSQADRVEAGLILQRTRAEDFSVVSWNDAYSYLTGSRVKASSEEARARLIQWLSE